MVLRAVLKCTDTELSRVYELEHDTQFLPLGIYTPDVDYTDTAVQVCSQREVVHTP